MIESSAGSAAQDRPIPDPRDEPPFTAQSALRDADRAARQARRLLEASRGILSGNMALIACLPATLMFWWQVGGDRTRVAGALVMIGFAAWVAVSLRWIVRLRSSGGVKVVDRIEANMEEIGERPIRRLVPAYAVWFGAFLAWSYLFKVLPYSGVVIAMWSVTGVLTGVFIAGSFYSILGGPPLRRERRGGMGVVSPPRRAAGAAGRHAAAGRHLGTIACIAAGAPGCAPCRHTRPPRHPGGLPMSARHPTAPSARSTP
jgi:hypothetical protein